MTRPGSVIPLPPKRMSREEKARQTYTLLLEAAAQVVGRDGYAEASIAKMMWVVTAPGVKLVGGVQSSRL